MMMVIRKKMDGKAPPRMGDCAMADAHCGQRGGTGGSFGQKVWHIPKILRHFSKIPWDFFKKVRHFPQKARDFPKDVLEYA